MAYNRWPSSSGSYEPITYVRGFPVDLTTLITFLHVVTTILCALALALIPSGAWVQDFIFSTDGFWQGKIWTVLTDPFFHNISTEHIWLALNLFLFYRFGTEIERLIGRNSFGILYAALMIVPVLACLAAAPLLGYPLGIRVPYVFTMVHFAVFIGFTYVYPGAMFLGGITARPLGIIYTVVIALALIAGRFWPMLIPFAAALATAYFYLSFVGAGRDLGILEVWQSWREQRHDQKIQKRRAVQKEVKREAEASVDAILDKISQHGIQSLTAKERAFLEHKGTQLRESEGKGR